MTIKFQSAARRHITPRMADKMLSDYPYKGQRPLRDGHVAELAAAMLNGEFTDGDALVATLGNQGCYLLDGQHTLWAISTAHDTNPDFDGVEITLKGYTVDSEEELAYLYSTIDIGRRRTTTDAVRAAGGGESFGVPEQYVGRVSSALKLIIEELHPSKRPVPAQKVVEIFETWAPSFCAYLAMLDEHRPEVYMRQALLRRDVLSVAMITIEDRSLKAGEFWAAVISDDGLHKGDPRKTLHDFLVASQVGTSVGRKTDYTIERGLRACAAAWNAFIDGRDLNRIVADADRVILKTTRFGKVRTTA